MRVEEIPEVDIKNVYLIKTSLMQKNLLHIYHYSTAKYHCVYAPINPEWSHAVELLIVLKLLNLKIPLISL